MLCNTVDLHKAIIGLLFLSGCLKQVLLYNQQSIYIYAYKCLCQCVVKVYYPNSNFVLFDMLEPII